MAVSIRISIVAAVTLWLVTATAPAQITLSQDFDAGALDVAASIAGDQLVELTPRRTWTAPGFADAYRWVYFQARGLQGLTPTFRLDAATFLGSLEGHRFAYSADGERWSFFDQGVVGRLPP